MSLAALITKLFEQIGKNMALSVPELADPRKSNESDRSIHVTPARRPVWPVCCG